MIECIAENFGMVNQKVKAKAFICVCNPNFCCYQDWKQKNHP
jgi:hypothetical protein